MRYCARWPVPSTPTLMRSFAPSTRDGASPPASASPAPAAAESFKNSRREKSFLSFIESSPSSEILCRPFLWHYDDGRAFGASLRPLDSIGTFRRNLSTTVTLQDR